VRFLCKNCRRVSDRNVVGPGQLSCAHCGAVTTIPATATVFAGAVIDNYVVGGRLGAGGMATVYRGHCLRTGQIVALKVLHPHLAANSEFVDAFLREGAAAMALKHPNIVEIYATGNDENIYYLTMEYIDGMTLHQVLESCGRLSVSLSMRIADKVVTALQAGYEHSRFLHNDIKPENIMLAKDEAIKLADLGLAHLGDGELPDTGGEEVIGTPQYISPERLTGELYDFRSDIYSLGATLYHLLTGRICYPAASAREQARQHLLAPLTPPHLLLPDIPQPLSDLLQLMLAKRPEHRYDNYASLYADIRQVRHGQEPLHILAAEAQTPLWLKLSDHIPDLNLQISGSTVSETSDELRPNKIQRRSRRSLRQRLSSWLGSDCIPETVAAGSDAPASSASPPPTAATTAKAADSEAWWNQHRTMPAAAPLFDAIDPYVLFATVQTKLVNNELHLIDIPENVHRITELLNDQDFDYSELVRLIRRSPALAGQFLAVANSAVYNRGVRITDLQVAALRIPPATIKSMLYLNTARACLSTNPLFRNVCELIVGHCLTVSTIANYLGQRYYPDPQAASMAGLLHDVGKIVILRTIGEVFEIPPLDFELTEGCFDEFLPAIHGKAGALIAEHWNLPPEIHCAITYHHDFYNVVETDTDNLGRNLAALICVSDTIARILGKGKPLQGLDIFAMAASELLGIEDNHDTRAYLAPLPTLVAQSQLQQFATV